LSVIRPASGAHSTHHASILLSGVSESFIQCSLHHERQGPWFTRSESNWSQMTLTVYT